MESENESEVRNEGVGAEVGEGDQQGSNSIGKPGAAGIGARDEVSAESRENNIGEESLPEPEVQLFEPGNGRTVFTPVESARELIRKRGRADMRNPALQATEGWHIEPDLGPRGCI